ncbi:hypothetical protein [Marseilla massiliensis]|uniref:Uncharacterized protein n=1 Tax=Marseilla massiliensis TaxID=1841864 RepID=A0A938WNN5_9BACT|nr:hypothetical protein [Marseilla massiliensis]MBM6661529.1 hypothetical protein [Marseilla massiliensis]
MEIESKSWLWMCEHMLRHTKTMPFSAQNDKNGHKNSHQPGGNTAHVTLQNGPFSMPKRAERHSGTAGTDAQQRHVGAQGKRCQAVMNAHSFCRYLPADARPAANKPFSRHIM